LRSILTQNQCGNPIELFNLHGDADKAQTDFQKHSGLTNYRAYCTKGDFCGPVLQAQHVERVFRIVEAFTGNSPKSILEGLNVLFPNPKWMCLYRHDKVKQAISHLKAKRTHSYSQYPSHEKKEMDYGEYSESEITHFLKQVCIWDSFWLTFFQENDIEPLFISYEELIANKVLTAVKIFEFLGHTPDSVKMNIELMPIRQYDAVSQAWYDKYLTDIHFCD